MTCLNKSSSLCMFVCWSLTSLCHSNGHIETMPAREINPFTALTRIRSQFLKLKDLFEQQVNLFMYDFVNKVLPEPLLGIYEYHGDIHGHETRHSTDPKPPNLNTELMRRSFLYKGPCIWLALDMHIKSSNSINV